MNTLHPNLNWEVRSGKEGQHLDLWVMLIDGKIEWKNYVKAPPLYVHKNSAHDPSVIKSIHKGVGQRLRMNSSKDEYFKDSVEEFSKAFAISGYDFQHSKRELNKFRNVDPVKLIQSEKQSKKSPPGCKVFYISNFDPRLRHPRKSLTTHYHLLASNPTLARLFPRPNLVAGCRRLPNLGEILSPTVQRGPPGEGGGGGPAGPQAAGTGEGRGGGEGGHHNGTYHCDLHKRTFKCDLCSHIVERSFVTSELYNGRKFAIQGGMCTQRPLNPILSSGLFI